MLLLLLNFLKNFKIEIFQKNLVFSENKFIENFFASKKRQNLANGKAACRHYAIKIIWFEIVLYYFKTLKPNVAFFDGFIKFPFFCEKYICFEAKLVQYLKTIASDVSSKGLSF